jgi:hypothetical protein
VDTNNKFALFQRIGKFYEMYGFYDEYDKHDDTKILYSNTTNIKEISDVLCLAIANTNYKIDGKLVCWAGFSIFSLKKYEDILTKNGYNVVICNDRIPN